MLNPNALRDLCLTFSLRVCFELLSSVKEVLDCPAHSIEESPSY